MDLTKCAAAGGGRSSLDVELCQFFSQSSVSSVSYLSYMSHSARVQSEATGTLIGLAACLSSKK